MRSQTQALTVFLVLKWGWYGCFGPVFTETPPILEPRRWRKSFGGSLDELDLLHTIYLDRRVLT